MGEAKAGDAVVAREIRHLFDKGRRAAAAGQFNFAIELYLRGIALAPDNVLGSVVIDLPRAFLAIARDVKSGNFKPKVEAFGLAGGVIRYDPNPGLRDRIPAALEARVRAAADSIARN